MASNGGLARRRRPFADLPPARWGLLVAACALALLALGPVYDTNDDPLIVGLLSGAGGGRPLDAAYLGAPLSGALQVLYAARPALPWYGLVVESCNLLSAGLWAGLIASCRPGPALRFTATAGLLLGYGYLLLRVNFMAAALSLFFAAVAWLWKLQLGAAGPRWREAWLGVAIGFAHLLRPSLQWVMLFFALPCLLLMARGKNLRRLALIGVPAAALILATVAGELRRHAEPAERERAAFNRARSLLVDIPRDPLPAALAAAGWSGGDYEMASRFGVYDEELYSTGRIRAFLAQAGGGGIARRLRTARTYVLGRFHLLCLAALICVLWAGAAEPAGAGVVRAPRGVGALTWCWVGAGTIALALTRFPPRAFVPLYFYLAALWFLAPPPLPAAGFPRPRARTVAPIAVSALLLFTLGFWVAEARTGKARLAAEARELAAGAARLGGDAILVPVGLLLDLQYHGALAPPGQAVPAQMPPGGWLIATPALREFLDRGGFASGRAFMQGLVGDRRIVFVVRRPQLPEAQWLVERLAERYAPGRRLTIEPLASAADSPGYLFFRVRAAAE